MLKANERRQKILEILCVRRQETMENLAQEFNVTIRTIRNDIEELTLAHPIETVRGRYGGGVRVADGYYLGRKYLKPDQQELLKRLSENLTGEDLATMNSILSEFALTKRQRNKSCLKDGGERIWKGCLSAVRSGERKKRMWSLPENMPDLLMKKAVFR